MKRVSASSCRRVSISKRQFIQTHGARMRLLYFRISGLCSSATWRWRWRWWRWFKHFLNESFSGCLVAFHILWNFASFFSFWNDFVTYLTSHIRHWWTGSWAPLVFVITGGVRWSCKRCDETHERVASSCYRGSGIGSGSGSGSHCKFFRDLLKLMNAVL